MATCPVCYDQSPHEHSGHIGEVVTPMPNPTTPSASRSPAELVQSLKIKAAMYDEWITLRCADLLALCDLAESSVRERDNFRKVYSVVTDGLVRAEAARVQLIEMFEQSQARVAALEGCIEQLRDFETLSFYDFKKKYGLQESPPDFEAYLVGIIDAALAVTREAPTPGEGLNEGA